MTKSNALAGGLLSALLMSVGFGCSDETTCFTGDDTCALRSPCAELAWQCEGGQVEALTLGPGDARPRGIEALAADGDIVLRNERVTAVIEALNHPHFVSPSGGALLDLTTNAEDDDSLNHLFQAFGLLPKDAVIYTEQKIIQEDALVAVEVKGHLEGDTRHLVSTRYELRPCEDGVRIRTEAVNLGNEPMPFLVADGWYLGGRSGFLFAPAVGVGFDYPSVSLSDIGASLRDVPYVAQLSSNRPGLAYSLTACNAPELTGFFAESIAATGLAPQVVAPRGVVIYERFIAVGEGNSLGPAIDRALDIREQLFDEAHTTIEGIVEFEGLGRAGEEASASVRIHDASDGRPVTQVTPDADGAFRARVPAGASYEVTVDAFGQAALARARVDDPSDAPPVRLSVRAAGELSVNVTIDGEADHALLLIYPADDETEAAVTGTRFGTEKACAPMLGDPYGPSPACNRVLVDGEESFAIPAGRYVVYATAGAFASIAAEEVEVQIGERVSLSLDLMRLPKPEGTLAADFHVHGGYSFDSMSSDEDRVRAFLAGGIDVIAITDHEVSHDYADARAVLDADARIAFMSGVETTGQILFELVPDDFVPRVIGHWNFWPVPFDSSEPYRGVAWDELAEPGALITRMVDGGFDHERGVVQLNHPWAETEFGRDLGFPRAIGINALDSLPRVDDGTGPGLLLRTPLGARFNNADYHTQEVMNGSDNTDLVAYRAYWHYLLREGVRRAGTANSDSHTNTDNVFGYPFTLVTTDTSVAEFDVDRFNEAVRAGHMMGSNGPLIEARIEDGDGSHSPGLETLSTDDGAALEIRVRGAAWVPIDELRVVVNGEVVLRESLEASDSPFDAESTVRFERAIPLADLIDGDAVVVIEAGRALPPAADLDCNGIPDTGDNNGDGTIDAADVGVEAEEDTPWEEVVETPAICVEESGPLRDPPAPDRGSAHYHFWAVVAGGYPSAFTNPFFIDADGDGQVQP